MPLSGPVWLVSKNYPIQYLDLEVSSSPAVRKTANPNLPLEAWRPQLRHFLQKRRWKLQSRMIVGRSQLQFSIIANRHFWTKSFVTFGRNCSLEDLDILGRFLFPCSSTSSRSPCLWIGKERMINLPAAVPRILKSEVQDPFFRIHSRQRGEVRCQDKQSLSF